MKLHLCVVRFEVHGSVSVQQHFCMCMCVCVCVFAFVCVECINGINCRTKGDICGGSHAPSICHTMIFG